MTVRLRRDYNVEFSLYQEDIGFYPKGTVGKILHMFEIQHLPGLTPEMHERLIAREVCAKDRTHFLVLLGWKIASIPVGVLRMENEED